MIVLLNRAFRFRNISLSSCELERGFKIMTKTKTKAIVIATAITTLLSATAAFADTTNSHTVQAPKFSQTQPGEAHDWFKNSIASLLNAGTLTEAQEVAIRGAISASPQLDLTKDDLKEGDNAFKTFLDVLVKARTITQAQEVAIQGSSD